MKYITVVASLIAVQAFALSATATSLGPPIVPSRGSATFAVGDMIDWQAGALEFDARLIGIDASTPVPFQGFAPYMVYAGQKDGTFVDFGVDFNSNNGSGGGGLSGGPGYGQEAATGFFTTNFTFGDILGADAVNRWHRYLLVWDQNGSLPGVPDSSKRTALFVDGKLDSGYWSTRPDLPFSGYSDLQLGLFKAGFEDRSVGIDNLKLYDADGDLILHNDFEAVTGGQVQSLVGPDGLVFDGVVSSGYQGGSAIYTKTTTPIPAPAIGLAGLPLAIGWIFALARFRRNAKAR